MFAEKKEVNRHIKRSHLTAEVATREATNGGWNPMALQCPHCNRNFKTPGWLNRHVKSNHGPAVPIIPNASPPPALELVVGPRMLPAPVGRPSGVVILPQTVGSASGDLNVVCPSLRRSSRKGRGGSVSSSGDRGAGQIGSCQSWWLRGLGGE